MNACVLDFDGSVQGMPDARVIPLRDQEERIRFACKKPELRSLGARIDGLLPSRDAAVFLGSGDFHHVTLPLIERLREKVEVVVFDNHPDNMRYPFGIHCGSWVSHVSRLPCVTRVHVAGITSPDVEGFHVAENRLAPLREGKVVYWCVGRDLRWLRRCGVRASRSFQSAGAMLAAFSEAIAASDDRLYLSVDKDVLAQDVVRTNWDQGVLQLVELTSTIRAMAARVVASDVTGDVSVYRYRGWWKRMLSGLDRQPDVDPERLAEWQHAHAAVNQELLVALSR